MGNIESSNEMNGTDLNSLDTPNAEQMQDANRRGTTQGIVSGCVRLNMRAEAKADGEVLDEIEKGTAVEICEAESTEEFFMVCEDGECIGYCVKKYITLQG